jgi:hypothetical protein
MGPAGMMPPALDFEWTAGPDSHRVIIKVQAACNWVQTIEGVIDSAHTNFLHADLVRPTAGVSQTRLGDDGAFSRPSNDGRSKNPAAAGLLNMQMFVPLDDESTMHYFVKLSDAVIDERQAAMHVKRAGTRMGIEIDEGYRLKRARRL